MPNHKQKWYSWKQSIRKIYNISFRYKNQKQKHAPLSFTSWNRCRLLKYITKTDSYYSKPQRNSWNRDISEVLQYYCSTPLTKETADASASWYCIPLLKCTTKHISYYNIPQKRLIVKQKYPEVLQWLKEQQKRLLPETGSLCSKASQNIFLILLHIKLVELTPTRKSRILSGVKRPLFQKYRFPVSDIKHKGIEPTIHSTNMKGGKIFESYVRGPI